MVAVQCVLRAVEPPSIRIENNTMGEWKIKDSFVDVVMLVQEG